MSPVFNTFNLIIINTLRLAGLYLVVSSIHSGATTGG